MKLSETEADKLGDRFFNRQNKDDFSLPLHERGLQQFWYNKRNFPWEPYSDVQHIGFDPEPQTYQDCIVIQERKLKKFFNKPGWINNLITLEEK